MDRPTHMGRAAAFPDIPGPNKAFSDRPLIVDYWL